MLYNRRNVNGQRYSNLPSSTTRVCTEFKIISVATYTENRVLRDDSRFIDHDPVSNREESLKSSKTVSRTSSEKASVDFRINKSNRVIVFNYSSSTSSTNKFQIPTTTTNTSIKNTGIILQKSDSKQKLQGRTAVVNTKFENLRCSLLDSFSQSSTDADRCIQKGMECSMSRDINRGAMVKGGIVVTHKCVRTESSKISTFDIQQAKIFESSSFSNTGWPKKAPFFVFFSPKLCFTIFFHIFQVVEASGLGDSFETNMDPSERYTTQQRIKIIEAYPWMIFIGCCVVNRPVGSILVSKESPKPAVYTT